MFVRGLEEGSDQELRVIGHILPHQKVNSAKYFMVCALAVLMHALTICAFISLITRDGSLFNIFCEYEA